MSSLPPSDSPAIAPAPQQVSASQVLTPSPPAEAGLPLEEEKLTEDEADPVSAGEEVDKKESSPQTGGLRHLASVAVGTNKRPTDSDTVILEDSKRIRLLEPGGLKCFVAGCSEAVDAKEQVCDDHKAVLMVNCGRGSPPCAERVMKIGGACAIHGPVKKICAMDGCMNEAKRVGGLCSSHAAPRKKQCSHEGCTKYPVSQGKCVKHGGKAKLCPWPGCTKQAQAGGNCIAHGYKPKRCAVRGCEKQAQRGGICIAHGAQSGNRTKRCSYEGCDKNVVQGGVCISHGAKRKRCLVEGCERYPVKNGLCISHGKTVATCVALDCNKPVQRHGLCAECILPDAKPIKPSGPIPQPLGSEVKHSESSIQTAQTCIPTHVTLKSKENL